MLLNAGGSAKSDEKELMGQTFFEKGRYGDKVTRRRVRYYAADTAWRELLDLRDYVARVRTAKGGVCAALTRRVMGNGQSFFHQKNIHSINTIFLMVEPSFVSQYRK